MWVATPADRKLTWRQITRKIGAQEPEFVEIHALQNGLKALRIGFLADNDFMPLLYVLYECLEPETVAWLKEYAINDDEQINEHPYDEPF